MKNRFRRTHGFTMVELIIVIAISGVVASMISSFIVGPVQAHMDQSRRAGLTDAAESAMRRMGRDIRRALPNSLRVSASGQSIEMLNTVDGVRYRDDPVPGDTDPDLYLDFSSSDDAFGVLGKFRTLNYGAQPSDYRLSIYHLGFLNADAYAGDNVITPAGTTITVTEGVDEDQVSLSPAFQFSERSPGQRLFVIDTPVTYLCDPTLQNIRRYQGYTITADTTSVDTDAELIASGAERALLSSRIIDCEFSYSAGASKAAALVTIKLTLGDAGGEQVSLLHQVHVTNTP